MHKLRRGLRAITTRRIIALVMTAFLTGSWFETVLPDVHDGDAPVTVHVAEASHGTAHHVNRSAPDQAPQPQNGDSHSAHVDHCGHGHFAATMVAWMPPAAATSHGDAPSWSVNALSSADPGGHFRPPIA